MSSTSPLPSQIRACPHSPRPLTWESPSMEPHSPPTHPLYRPLFHSTLCLQGVHQCSLCHDRPVNKMQPLGPYTSMHWIKDINNHQLATQCGEGKHSLALWEHRAQAPILGPAHTLLWASGPTSSSLKRLQSLYSSPNLSSLQDKMQRNLDTSRAPGITTNSVSCVSHTLQWRESITGPLGT